VPASHPRLRGCTASWIWRRRAGGREGQRSSYARACDAVQFWGDEQIWIEGSRRREEGWRRLWRARRCLHAWQAAPEAGGKAAR